MAARSSEVPAVVRVSGVAPALGQRLADHRGDIVDRCADRQVDDAVRMCDVRVALDVCQGVPGEHRQRCEL